MNRRALLVRWLSEYPYLSTSQCYVLSGVPRVLDKSSTPQHNVRVALLKAYKADVLERRKVTKSFTERGIAITEYVYKLPSTPWPDSILHDLDLNELHLALAQRPDWKESYWFQENLRVGGINPDAMFWWKYFYLVERERQRNSIKGLVRKARQATAFCNANLYHLLHEKMRGFVLLFVVTGDLRKRNLLLALRRASLDHEFIRVGTIEAVTMDPTEAIWHSPRGTAYSL